MKSTYDEVYARWQDDPEGFWADAAEAVHWYKKWDKVLDASRPRFYRWFSGGVVNTCYNALDRQVANGRAEQPALIYDSPVTQTIKVFSYRDLLDEVSRFAGVLQRQGARKGDRVIVSRYQIVEQVSERGPDGRLVQKSQPVTHFKIREASRPLSPVEMITSSSSRCRKQRLLEFPGSIGESRCTTSGKSLVQGKWSLSEEMEWSGRSSLAGMTTFVTGEKACSCRENADLH